MREVDVRDDGIRLGQFLKLAGLADTGADARVLLDLGEVEVNGEAESRRGRQLRPGDVVSVGDEQVRVSLQPGAPGPL
ncbi:MAG: ribosome-associated protein [Actinomycetota bacterium]|jgi:ribosome-associated protein|nr:ribosome-associated protein [Actinomycetota bacterium]